MGSKNREVKNEEWPVGENRNDDDNTGRLVSESVQRLSGTLEGVDNVEGSNSLALGVFGVGNRVTDDV